MAGRAVPSCQHNIPADFPYTRDWLKLLTESYQGDDHPWEQCANDLIKAEYLHVSQIETADAQEILKVCEHIIKGPMVKSMLKYVNEDCEAICINKATGV